MNVSRSGAVDQLIRLLQASESKPAETQANVQVALLDQALQAEKEQAAELLKLVAGKGQIIDIRV